MEPTGDNIPQVSDIGDAGRSEYLEVLRVLPPSLRPSRSGIEIAEAKKNASLKSVLGTVADGLSKLGFDMSAEELKVNLKKAFACDSGWKALSVPFRDRYVAYGAIINTVSKILTSTLCFTLSPAMTSVYTFPTGLITGAFSDDPMKQMKKHKKDQSSMASMIGIMISVLPAVLGTFRVNVGVENKSGLDEKDFKTNVTIAEDAREFGAKTSPVGEGIASFFMACRGMKTHNELRVPDIEAKEI